MERKAVKFKAVLEAQRLLRGAADVRGTFRSNVGTWRSFRAANLLTEQLIPSSHTHEVTNSQQLETVLGEEKQLWGQVFPPGVLDGCTQVSPGVRKRKL